jgi:acyl carrier protein
MTRPAPTIPGRSRVPEDVRAKVIRILAEQAVLAPGDVRPDMTLEELGIDSLGLVETVFAIEEAFDIQVPFNANAPDKSAFDIATVDSIARAVEALVAERA